MIKHVLLAVTALMFADPGSQVRTQFRITIDRERQTADCTRGRMLVNGEYLCRTLELPWKENASLVSSIPPGTYQSQLRYDKADQWRIQLEGVPGRTGIQIHVGNYPREIQGCILVGLDIDASGCSIVAGTSAPAYAALKKKFFGTEQPTSCPDVDIVIEVLPVPSSLGTWKDGEGRFTLTVEKSRVLWTEKNKAGVELTRELSVDGTAPNLSLERPNDDAVLKFLDFGDKTRQELLRRGVSSSKLTLSAGREELTGEWTGIKVTKTRAGEIESITYPVKKIAFKRKPS